jgi:hypothetical protein
VKSTVYWNVTPFWLEETDHFSEGITASLFRTDCEFYGQNSMQMKTDAIMSGMIFPHQIKTAKVSTVDSRFVEWQQRQTVILC